MTINRLEKAVNYLEEQRRNHLLRLTAYKGFDQEWYNAPPEPGKWSPHQIHRHVMKSELGSIHYLQKKTQDLSDLGHLNWKSTYRTLLLYGYLHSPFKIKAPKMVEVGSVYGSLEACQREWEENRMDMLEFLGSLPEEAFKKPAYRHPMVGRIGIFHMLKFFSWHAKRHYAQIEHIARIDELNPR